MRTATIKTIEQSEKVGLYSICSDQILIVANGGAKTTRTYEESEELSGYVIDLQKFDALLEQEQKKWQNQN